MTAIAWTSAPAGMPGQGLGEVRPYRGVDVCPTAEPTRGTGLPMDGFAAGVRGVTRIGNARLRRLNSAAELTLTSTPAAQNLIARQSTQNDGTTLGIHPPGRPQS